MSVIVGEPQQVLRDLAENGTPVVSTRAVVAREMAIDFLAQTVSPTLRDHALAVLAGSSARAEWEHKSAAERALWMERLQSKPLSLEAAFALQWLQNTEGEVASDPIAQVALLSQWRPAVELPVLASCGAPRVLAQTVALAEAAPRLAVAFLVDEAALSDTLNAQTPHVRALLRDSIVRPPAVQQVSSTSKAAKAIPRSAIRPEHLEDAAPVSESIHEALREPELQRLREAARQTRELARAERASGNVAPEAEDRARSMVERFLYELLQRSPHTRDLFELNARLPFRFGARALEADFAARSLRLVLEVDGYFHFVDPDGYRRDRRKDVLLQQRGYLVARFLAEDVLDRTMNVLGQIEQLVTSRRRQENPEED